MLTILIIIISTINLIIFFRMYMSHERKKFKKLLSHKKRSETVLGQISETLSPFLDDFPAETPKDAVFLGMPIDFVYFGKDEIKFIEVKSGKSQLSSKQRRIRDQIKNGKVSFEIYRVPKKLKK